MANRTFGWIQNPSSTDTLKDILGLFVPKSAFHTFMVNERLPLLASANLFDTPGLYMEFQKALRLKKPIAYSLLKGRGSHGGSRLTAKCSGLVQAAIIGQQYREYTVDGKTIRIKKPYTDDWTADGFLRWAVSLGFLDYNYANDTCSITNLGSSLVLSKTTNEKNAILGQAFLSYPPVCRVLSLLSEQGHLTKFEIGSKLGFTDEAGFTSFPQNIWVQAYEESTDEEEKTKLRANTEGSSDKYARMICGWLEGIGWVKKTPKTVKEKIGSKSYTCEINSAFEITEDGMLNYNLAFGKNSTQRMSKIVYREMLASKASNANYLRMRRSLILESLSDHGPKSVTEINDFLASRNIDEKITTIQDDLCGLINIGLDIEFDGERYRLNDIIQKLTPFNGTIVKETTDSVIIKDRVRLKLHHVNHKYLTLIDYAFSGKNNCMDFEVYTIDLLVNELAFNGVHLGGTRKPDGIFYHNRNGIIIDNKAYSHGFTLSRAMADEMIRYIQENNDRNPERNPNKWWENFDKGVNQFNFVFISSLFKGEIEHMLTNIKQSTDGVQGCVLSAENLLYFAEAMKSGVMQKTEFISYFGAGKEIQFPTDRLL